MEEREEGKGNRKEMDQKGGKGGEKERKGGKKDR